MFSADCVHETFGWFILNMGSVPKKKKTQTKSPRTTLLWVCVSDRTIFSSRSSSYIVLCLYILCSRNPSVSVNTILSLNSNNRQISRKIEPFTVTVLEVNNPTIYLLVLVPELNYTRAVFN